MVDRRTRVTSVQQFRAAEMPPGDWRHQLIDGIPLTASGPYQAHMDLEARLRDFLTPAVPSGFRLEERQEIAPGGPVGYDLFELDLAVVPDGPGKPDFCRPILIVEVLSSHTESFDTGRKLDVCRGLPGMIEILHVSSERVDVALHRCGGNQDRSWTTDRAGQGGTITLASLGLLLAVEDLYGSRPAVSTVRHAP